MLYFTNGAQKVCAKIAIKPDGTPSAGPATIIADSPTGGSYNDFGLDFFGDAYLATGGGDSIAGVQANGKQRIVAGMMGSTDLRSQRLHNLGGRCGIERRCM